MKNKKLISLIIAVVVVLGIIFIPKFMNQSEKDTGSKKITIVVENHLEGDSKVLYNNTVKTDAATLEELLVEVKDLEVVITQGEWGAFIESMCGIAQDSQNGAYWMYSSDNNAGCVANGYCDGASLVELADGDAFTFYIEAYLPQ